MSCLLFRLVRNNLLQDHYFNMIVAYTRRLQSRVRCWQDLGPSPPKPFGDQPFSCITSLIKSKRGADLNITNSNHHRNIFVNGDPGTYVLLLVHYSNLIPFLHEKHSFPLGLCQIAL
jgi:hypothetical protein